MKLAFIHQFKHLTYNCYIFWCKKICSLQHNVKNMSIINGNINRCNWTRVGLLQITWYSKNMIWHNMKWYNIQYRLTRVCPIKWKVEFALCNMIMDNYRYEIILICFKDSKTNFFRFPHSITNFIDNMTLSFINII